MTATKDDSTTVGYLFQFTCDIGNGKNLHVSGNFDKGASTAEMNAEVDKIDAAFDRKRAQHEAPLIEERLEGMRMQLESREADLALFLEQHPNLKGMHEANVNKMRQEIVLLNIQKTRGEITLAQTRAKAA